MTSITESEEVLCAYCGIRTATENAHVISRCLFPQPMPGNVQLKTIPACHDCNHALSKDEEYIRDALVVDNHAANSPAAKIILHGPTMRAVRNNRSVIARTANQQARLEPMYTKGGIYVGHAYSFPIDNERISRAMSMIVRGLYYCIQRQRFPQDCVFQVNRADPFQLRAVFEDTQKFSYNGPYTLGDGVFTCWFIYGQEEPSITHWFLLFYNSIGILVWTEPANFDWEVVNSK